MRLPLVAIFALLLALVLLGMNKLIRKNGPVTLLSATLILLAVLAVQQYFALRDIHRERHEFSMLLNRVERAVAPGVAVVAEWNLTMPLYAYGSDILRQQLRSTIHSFPDIPPVKAFHQAGPGEEAIYVGSMNDYLAQQLRASGYSFHEYQTVQTDASELIARYYRAKGVSIYYVVSPPVASSPAAAGSAAVSLKL